jgi:hypothetical protein
MKRLVSLIIIVPFILVVPTCKKEKKDVTVARQGYVNFINGEVKLIAEDGAERVANIGDEVTQGVKIKTIGDKSFVDIYFGENIVKVLGNTLIEVKKLVANITTNGEESEFFVEKGKMFSKVTRKLAKSDVYQVKTPTTTAGVRGTDFLVSEEDGKANVACLEGKLAVLNNSMPKSDPVFVDDEKEVDVEPNKAPMVKDLSDENKKRMQDIIKNISEMRKEIWEKMEKQREEIKKYVVDQKEKDKSLVDEQKEKDKGLVEDQKARDREMMESVKGKTKDKGDEAVKAAKDKMDAAKDVDKDAAKRAAEEQKEKMKPKIEKPKVDLNQFKKTQ